jgi:hypothetical protein
VFSASLQHNERHATLAVSMISQETSHGRAIVARAPAVLKLDTLKIRLC